MALELVAGAALGTAFAELTKAVLNFSEKSTTFKSILNRFQSTLLLIGPLVHEIVQLDRQLDIPVEETERFTNQLKEAADLINKCSEKNIIKKASYSTKLKEMDASLVKFFQTYVQALQTRDIKRIQATLNEICAKMDGTRKYGVQVDCGQNVFGGSCGAPGVPVFTVGLDVPLQELKMRLLEHDEQVVVLSAPGGCGKTTLAKMLCHDVQIKGIFRDNIFFVTVSETPNLTAMVENMFRHKSFSVSGFQNDDDAINQLEIFLNHIGQDHVLLVLDDVWSGSESLIQKFMFQMRGYKILVTSRSEFPRFNSTYKLELLSDQDAMALFRHSAFSQGGSINIPEDLVHKIVEGCRGFPLALTMVGGALCGRPEVIWRRTLKQWSKEGQSIFDSNRDLLIALKNSIDALDENVKECFLDLGSFPEDQRIPATALIDMWAELYNLDEDLDEEGEYALANIDELASRNLVKLVFTRENPSAIDGFYNEHFVAQHDLIRELAIHQSSQEQRKRLIKGLKGNDLSEWSIEQIQPFHARLISNSTGFSTDETCSSSRDNILLPENTFSSSWFSFSIIKFFLSWFSFSNIYKLLRYPKNMQLPEVEVLILNFRTRNYSLPKFIEKMDRLKVLIITNYDVGPADLSNFQLVGLLSSLKRLRLDHVSISFLIGSTLQFTNLWKISLTMCKIGKTFGNCTVKFASMFPNLVEIDIHCCSDLGELPEGLCDIVCLKKLSITKCNDLDALPQRLGRLTNLEVLRLHSCTGLMSLPESVGSLHKLRFLDISDCLFISELPIQIGELCGLEKIDMRGCLLHQLPPSVNNLGQLKDVICDEDTVGLWEPFEAHLNNLNIIMLEEDKNLNWLPNLHH